MTFAFWTFLLLISLLIVSTKHLSELTLSDVSKEHCMELSCFYSWSEIALIPAKRWRAAFQLTSLISKRHWFCLLLLFCSSKTFYIDINVISDLMRYLKWFSSHIRFYHCILLANNKSSDGKPTHTLSHSFQKTNK